MKPSEVLERHFTHWRQRGLVTPELETALRAASAELQEPTRVPWVRWAVALLGGALVLTGLILIVAENWAALPRGVKLGGWAAILFLLLGAAERATRAFERPLLGEVLALVAGGWVLGGIALVSQIYHLSSRPANGFWLWFALVLPAAFLLPWRATAVVLFAGLTTALTFEVSDASSWLVTPHGYTPWLWLGVPLLAAGLVSWLPRAALLLRGVLGVWLFVAGQVFVLVLGASERNCHNELGAAWTVALAGVALMFLRREYLLPPAWGREGPWVVLLPLLPWALIGNPPDPDWRRATAVALAWGLQLVAAILLIRAAARAEANAWVNLGFLALLAGIIVRYFDFFGQYLEGGLTLLVTGVLILAVIALLERQRRRVLASGGGGS